MLFPRYQDYFMSRCHHDHLVYPYGPISLRNIRDDYLIFFQRNLRFLSVFLSPSVLKYKNEYRSLCISTVVVKCDWLSEAVMLVSDLS